MEVILLGILIGLAIPSAVYHGMELRRIWRLERERSNERQVQAAMDEAAEEESRRSRQMDEGFENLMTYAVKLGRGVETGGAP